MDDENEVIYVGVEDMNANVEGGVVPDTRSMAVKRSGGIIIAWLLACHLYGLDGGQPDSSLGRWLASRCQKSELKPNFNLMTNILYLTLLRRDYLRQ